MQGRRQLSQYHIAQYFRTVIIVFVGVLNETEAIHVAHERFAISTKFDGKKLI